MTQVPIGPAPKRLMLEGLKIIRRSGKAPEYPPLRKFDIVELKSGGPAGMVVDVSGDWVEVAWFLAAEIGKEALAIPRACVRRIERK